MKYYAGIGSRTTPKQCLRLMQEFAYRAAKAGWTLRSGGASGADTAFELGCDDAIGPKEIFLPWAQYNQHESTLYNPSDDARVLASHLHPAWKTLAPSIQRLVARNMHQVLGKTLDLPVQCVICYTADGAERFEDYSIKTGGTGTAIALASVNNIPVFNLRNNGRYTDALEFLLT